MIEPFRSDFNTRQFSQERFDGLVEAVSRRVGCKVEFPICETPCFFPSGLIAEMIDAGRVLTHQLIDSPGYMKASEAAIPEAFRVPGESLRPHFMTVDFGLVAENGRLRPKLVELQAFPSIFGYQDVLSEEYQRVYGLDASLERYLGGLDSAGYWQLLRRTIVGNCDPENVVLMEVEPEAQKTLPDFNVYADRLGVQTVDVAKVRKQGRKLFYERAGAWVPIDRIFNRAIVDEMMRKGIAPGFDYRDELEVEWAGQPNWYFQISKFSLPYLDHSTVPRAVYLDEWFAGERAGLPEDRSEVLLKPLYSFAGKGIQFGPSDEDLAAIPVADRRLYLLQERVHFEPVIRTPYGVTQAEIRVMYLWPDDAAEMQPAMSLVRLGRGLMMGVDHNHHQRWVGGSAAFVVPEAAGNGGAA